MYSSIQWYSSLYPTTPCVHLFGYTPKSVVFDTAVAQQHSCCVRFSFYSSCSLGAMVCVYCEQPCNCRCLLVRIQIQQYNTKKKERKERQMYFVWYARKRCSVATHTRQNMLNCSHSLTWISFDIERRLLSSTVSLSYNSIEQRFVILWLRICVFHIIYIYI